MVANYAILPAEEHMKKYLILSSLIFTACTSHPVIPEKSDIIVSRNEAAENCRPLGPIEGRSIRVNATPAEALDDLKAEAIKKGANYIKIETMGALASAIRGMAYLCN